MNYYKKFTVSALLMVVFASTGVFAQSGPCDIPVKAEVTDATPGSRTGVINLDFGSTSTKNIKIFLATAGTGAAYKEQSDTKLTGLRAGTYDILIVDTSRKECVKQMTVEVKSR